MTTRSKAPQQSDTEETAGAHPPGDAVTAADTDTTEATDEAQEGSGGGGWIPKSKRDRRLIVTRYPEHAGTLNLIWEELLDEANRVHSHTFKLTRGQLAQRCAVSPRLIDYRLQQLKALKLLKTQSTRAPGSNRFSVSVFTVKPSEPVCNPVRKAQPSADGEPSATDTRKQVSTHITRTPSSKGGSCIKKKREGKDVFSGLAPNGAPKTSAPSSGEKKSTATDIGTAIDFGRWV